MYRNFACPDPTFHPLCRALYGSVPLFARDARPFVKVIHNPALLKTVAYACQIGCVRPCKVTSIALLYMLFQQVCEISAAYCGHRYDEHLFRFDLWPLLFSVTNCARPLFTLEPQPCAWVQRGGRDTGRGPMPGLSRSLNSP